MLTLDQIKAALEDRKLSTVAKKSGVSRQTIWRIMSGKSQKISYESVKSLSDYLSLPFGGESGAK